MKTLEQIKKEAIANRPWLDDYAVSLIADIFRAIMAEDAKDTTQPPKEPEIAKCVCGSENPPVIQTVGIEGVLRHVKCAESNCWSGPARLSKTDAIQAWNQVMQKLV